MAKVIKKRIDEKHIASGIFGSYILNNRVVPGMKISERESLRQRKIASEISLYSEQA